MGTTCGCNHAPPEYEVETIDLAKTPFDETPTPHLAIPMVNLEQEFTAIINDLKSDNLLVNVLVSLITRRSAANRVSLSIVCRQICRCCIWCRTALLLTEKRTLGSCTLSRKEISDAINNCREYKGAIVYADGGILEGGFVRGTPNGYCRFIDAKGDCYEGNFINGQLNGRGTLETANGTIYTGEWRNFQKHGKGTEKEVDGSKYVGDFINGKREGEGKLTLSDGSVYIGGFWNGAQQGNGVWTGPAPSTYSGAWKAGVKCGKGRLVMPDGAVYEGEFEDDLKEGPGTLTLWGFV
eukprot:TRINITY_DN11528_c0_g3_i1.p1 TRINITY_DN11528_c0_g3~~TRINITY_DN11528_c0_g3_i1.p1  ORF type:complete len:295 (-),score=28.99 TRINITY_DN11528_c0_g3_i1:227-1111(-)